MTVGRLGAERSVQVGVELLVRPVIRPANDVGDAGSRCRRRRSRGGTSACRRSARAALLRTAARDRRRAPRPDDVRRARSGAPGLRPRRCRASERSATIASSPPGTFRAGSVSSIRSSMYSPKRRFATALSALPTWSVPVGLGANRTRGMGSSLSGGARASRYPGPRALVGCRGGRGHDARAHRRGARDGAVAGRARGAARGRPGKSVGSPRRSKRGGGAAGDHALGQAHSQSACGSCQPSRSVSGTGRSTAGQADHTTRDRGDRAAHGERQLVRAPRGAGESDRHHRRGRRRLPVLLRPVLRVSPARELRRTERRRRRREDGCRDATRDRTGGPGCPGDRRGARLGVLLQLQQRPRAVALRHGPGRRGTGLHSRCRG